MICVECGAEFMPPNPKSKRVTCSRPCSSALAWKKSPEKRIAAITKAKSTPAARARSVEINLKRWAKPGARAKLSRWNRERWADPKIAAELGAAIRAVWTPERRAGFSVIRTLEWANDKTYRDRTVAGIRRSKGRAESRILFSSLLRARWQKPEWREKWLAGMNRRMADPEERAKVSAFALRRWADCKAAGMRSWKDLKAPKKQFSMMGDTWSGWRSRR